MGSAIAPRHIRRAIAEQKLAPPLGLTGDASAPTVHCYHCSNRFDQAERPRVLEEALDGRQHTAPAKASTNHGLRSAKA